VYGERIIKLKSFDLGSLVRNYRIDKNMTQEQLAELFECSSSTISRMEKGESLPNKRIYENVITYAKLVDRSIIVENDTSLFGTKGHSGLLEALEGRKWDIFEEKLYALKYQADKNPKLRQLYEMAMIIWEILYIQHMEGNIENIPERIGMFRDRLVKAITYTIPDFPKSVEREERRFSHTEIVLLNGYVFASFIEGEKETAMNILRMLSGSLKSSLREDIEYYKAEAALYNNKAVIAMRIGKNGLASNFLNKGIDIARVHGNIYVLIALMQNQAKNFFDMGYEVKGNMMRKAYQSMARTVTEEENGVLLQETKEGTVLYVF